MEFDKKKSFTCGWRFGDLFSEEGFHVTMVRLGYREWWNEQKVIEQLQKLSTQTYFRVVRYDYFGKERKNPVLVVEFVNQQLNKEVKKIYDSIRYPRNTIWKKPFYKVEFHISFWEKIDERNKFQVGDILHAKSFFIKKEKSDDVIFSMEI